MTKHKSEDEVYLFLPVRRHIAILSLIVGIFIMVNVYAIILYDSIMFKISIVLLIFLFIFLFVPVIRNRRIIVTGNSLRKSIYGNWYSLSFSRDLYSIVQENGVVVSYRFRSDGPFYQISPSAYYETDQLKNTFTTLTKKHKLETTIIDK